MNYKDAMAHFGHPEIAKAIQAQDGVKDSNVESLPKAFGPKPAKFTAPKMHEVPGIRAVKPRRLMPRLGKLSGDY